MAPLATTSQKDYWATYKYYFLHRLVKKGDRKGLVTRVCYSTKQLPSQEPSPQSVYEIMWFDGEPDQPSKAVDLLSLDRIKYPEFKKIVTDKFVVHPEMPVPPVIEHMILPLHKMKWQATKAEHSALIAKAEEVSQEMKQRVKAAEKQLAQLIAVTDKEIGSEPKPPKHPKAPKAPKAASSKHNKSKAAAAAAGGAAAKPPKPDKGKAAAGKGKPAVASKSPGGAGASSVAAAAGKPAKTPAAAPAGPSSGRKAAAKDSKGSRSGATAEGEASSDFEAAPAQKHKSASNKGAAATDKKRKKQPEQDQPTGKPLQEQTNKKQKTAAAAGGAAGAGSSSAAVKGVTGRTYPADVVCKAGDRRLGTPAYAEGNEDTEYPVETIVDEVEITISAKGGKTKKQVKVLPKWQGYELDIRGWEDKSGLKEVEAYVAWSSLADKPAYFNAVSNADAAEAYLTWTSNLAKASKKKK